MTITHRFWNVQMKQVMFVGHAVLDALRGRSVGGVSGGGGESAEIDLRQLKRAKAAGAKTLESSMKTNNLRDFMSRSSATVARGCPGPDEGRGHPFVDAMSKYAWAQHAHVVPMESQEQKDARWSNPAEYALLGDEHPRRGTMMIHLRGMARSHPRRGTMMIHLRGMARTRKNAKGDRAPRIPLIDGWQPFRVTNCGDSEGLQQTDAMCKAFLFDVGLRCPSSSAEGACPRCVSVTGVAKLGRCFCPWVESLSEKNSSGQPCYAATLAARREEWEQLSARVEAWETRERQHATLAGFWDELHYSVGEPCLAHPGVGDADFLRDHYQGGCLLSHARPPHTHSCIGTGQESHDSGRGHFEQNCQA